MPKLLYVLLFLFLTLQSKGQKIFLDGYLYADSINTPVAGAHITSVQSKQTVLTNNEGYFKLLVTKGANDIIINHIGFYPLNVNYIIKKHKTESFYLKENIQTLDTVAITLNRRSIIQTNLNNYHLLKRSDLEKVPGFLGSTDLIKTIQTLPGIGNGGEGNSALLVRGGSTGQNLILFNQAVIYNPSHLLGFFSVFNTTSIDEVKFYKSGIPAEYGGRLASILDVHSNSKVIDSLTGQVSLSILAAEANLNLPLTKKWTVSTSIRKTFMNYLIWPIFNKLNHTSSINDLAYDFYDINVSSALNVSEKDQIFLFSFLGGDKFGFDINRMNVANGMDWQNRAASLNWRRVQSSKVTVNTSLSYSGYDFNFKVKQDGFNARIESSISDWNAKSTLNIFLNQHSLKVGLNYIDHTFKPNIPFAQSGNTSLNYGVPRVYHAEENAFFVSDDWTINNKLSVYIGSRLTYYRHKGPFVSETAGITQNFPKNKTISSVTFIEPGASFKYKITTSSALKLTFSENEQPIHLIPVTASNFPTDFWMPSTHAIKPEKGSQLSFGFFGSAKNNQYEGYVDLFYKRLKNLIEFSGGIMNLLDNIEIEDNVTFGKGYAYGSEFYLKKNTGNLKGYISYTLSKNRRIFAAINNGRDFPFKYDRNHEITVVPNFLLNKRWDLTTLFTFSTGNAFTMPLSRYLISGNVINEYGKYNSARMPSYHRLDMALNYHSKLSQYCESTFSISIYNVYNRLNPIYNFFLASGDLKDHISVQKKSIALLPVLPAISYKVCFKK